MAKKKEYDIVSKVGRPTKYHPDMLPYVEKCSKIGLSQAQIAGLLEIDVSTLWHWMKERPEFRSAVKSGCDLNDDLVERSLFQRALGFEHPETRFFSHEGEVTDEREVVKCYPPDATSAIFWLKNRRPEKWREKTEIEITGKIDSLVKTCVKVLNEFVPEAKKKEAAQKLMASLDE